MNDWLRAFHIIAVIAWMAGMLIYPRLLIYRLEGAGNVGLETAMDAAAKRTRNLILTPAMIVVWLFGIGLASMSFGFYAQQPWFWVKITLVLAMSGLHGYFMVLGKKIAAGERPIAPKTLRMINELPMVIALVVVIMVVVQPFAH